MLACARIGAAHTVIFGGFSAEAVRDRVEDAKSKLIITADGGCRRGDDRAAQEERRRGAQEDVPTSKNVIVLKRTGQAIDMQAGRDVWWHELVKEPSAECPAEPMDAEDLLFVLYTSGSTGKPKGILHTTGGYLVGIAVDRTSRSSTSRRTTSTGVPPTSAGSPATPTSSTVRSPTARRRVMYEGAPNFPDYDRFWAIDREARRHDLLHRADRDPRLHALGRSVPATSTTSRACACSAPSASRSTRRRGCGITKVIGGGRCPIVDTWWQTETGSIMITPLPGVTVRQARLGDAPVSRRSTPRSSTRRARPGQRPGYLVLRKPWPCMLRGIFGDPDRFVKQYWSTVPRHLLHRRRRQAATRTATSGSWAASTT